MKTVVVTAGVMRRGEKVLIARRGEGRAKGRWEFPGGKVKRGEGRRACLRRELREELGIDVKVGRWLFVTEHASAGRNIRLCFYEVTGCGGRLRRRVHSETAWVRIAALGRYDLLPGDRAFVKEWLGRKR